MLHEPQEAVTEREGSEAAREEVKEEEERLSKSYTFDKAMRTT